MKHKHHLYIIKITLLYTFNLIVIFFLTSILYIKPSFSSINQNTLHIAVSANFLTTLKHIKPIFEKKYNCTLIISTDSTANLYTKIINGAPFDIFMSADTKHPKLLKNLNFTIKNTFTYAKGKISLWIPNINKNIKQTFSNKNFKKLAISNPKLSPYGNATIYTLKNLKIKTEYIYGCNVNQTFNFILTKNARMGFIALSQIINYKINKKNYWIIPRYLYPILKQKIVILKNTKNIKLAKNFIKFLKNKKTQHLISTYGYKIK